MILCDREILDLFLTHGMIDPFVEGQRRDGVISYGLSSYGYDMRASNRFMLFSNIQSGVVDPKNFDESNLVEVEGDVLIPPNSFVLTRSVEYVRMPSNVIGVCLGKSTYARCGLVVNATPLEPGWEGHITIEISNTTPLPARVYAGEGIMQVLFFKGEPCEVTYADRDGKYQGQTGIQLPKIGNRGDA